MRVLVTGAGGILGRHVIRHLTRLAPDTEVIVNKADLTSLDAVRAQLAASPSIDKVIHLAALVPVASVTAEPARAYAVNVGGTINLLSALEGKNTSFLICSSSHVYAPSPKPIREDAEKAPASFYGRTKWQAESVAADICEAIGRPFLATRVFSIHDPAQTGSFLRPSIERRLASEDLRQPFELPGGDSVRDFLPAEKAAEYVVRLALSSATGPVNVASGKGTTIRDFVQGLNPHPLEIRATGSADTLVADISRLRQILGDLDV
ncbi:NAD-dependent epimerase/dehydratase family protein [Aliirhizobium smilacinae]|uniref:NAD(P)-dependent oxidoreductase n=1 Tax=Aliirhizobium smilacinae TaxID=1395944 RepID=A0A5C4XDX3_9HYPH|nr:NAD(P)-dependent oxidoreductase [Rhizobium smilacinae]TNM61713.1 NAD(P)-dependent oxidoreductase [Rhizobium smilacinae]